jgi:hypothetical protein
VYLDLIGLSLGVVLVAADVVSRWALVPLYRQGLAIGDVHDAVGRVS